MRQDLWAFWSRYHELPAKVNRKFFRMIYPTQILSNWLTNIKTPDEMDLRGSSGVRFKIRTEQKNERKLQANVNPNSIMKITLSIVAALSAAVLITSGCARSRVENNMPSTQTQVTLTHGNYKMIKAGAEGRSYGFRFFLGIIPITAPSTAAARADLYNSLGQSMSGRSVALINTTEDRSTTWLLLFSVPKIVLTGDVVEFAQDGSPQAVLQTAAPQ